MELLHWFVDVVLHLDVHLVALIADYGAWIYVILFLIIFCETGLVVTPFLPGDSLLFVAGAVAAAGEMNAHLLAALLIAAAILGNQCNYQIGRYLGPRLFKTGNQRRWLRQDYLDRTHAFFVRHGGKTIVLSRFVPIIRTYAPFVAGLSRMHYGTFTGFNVLGALLWVASLIYAGYFFGNLPWVKANLSLVIVGIIVLSLLPVAFEHLRARARTRLASPPVPD